MERLPCPRCKEPHPYKTTVEVKGLLRRTIFECKKCYEFWEIKE